MALWHVLYQQQAYLVITNNVLVVVGKLINFEEETLI